MRYILALLFLSISCLHAQETITIDEAVRTALANNPTVRATREQAEAARARVSGARAERLPQVDLTVEHIRTDTSATFVVPSLDPNLPPSEVAVSSQDNTTATITARQAIYTGGRRRAQITRAEALFDAAIAQLGVTEAQVAFRTRSAYYDTLLGESLIRSAEQTLAAARQQLEVATARFEVGVAAQFDVLRAQTQVSEAEQALAEARNQAETARIALHRAMGVPQSRVFNMVEPGTAPVPTEDLPSLIETAEQQRAEILSARARESAAEAGIDVARSERLPQLTLAADYQVVTEESPIQDSGWSIIAAASIEIFDGGRTNANVAEARALRNEAEANLDEAVQAVEEEVRQAYLDIQTNRQTIETARARLAQAQEAYDIAVVRYEAGVGTAVELTDALAALATARTNLDQAIFNYNIAYARLQRALGRVIYP